MRVTLVGVVLVVVVHVAVVEVHTPCVVGVVRVGRRRPVVVRLYAYYPSSFFYLLPN